MKASLHIVSQVEGDQVIDLYPGRYVIGRDAEAAIRIDSRKVSRKHAEVVVDEKTIRLLDCGSANGTLLNGDQVATAELQNGDEITIGEVVLRFCAEVEGEKPEIKSTLQKAPEKLASLLPLTKTRSLQKILMGSLVVIFGGLSLIGGLSFKKVLSEKLSQEATQRAQELVRFLAEKNREDLRVGNDFLLDVDSVAKEKGVREAVIVNAKGRTLAPVSQLNQMVQDPFTGEALAQNSNRKIQPSPAFPDGTRVLVHPIRAYSDKTGKYETLGAVKVVFSPQDAVGSLPEINRLLFLLVTFALILAILVGWVFSRVLAVPLHHLAERIHQWRSGLPAEGKVSPFKEWNPLYEAVERVIEDQKE